MAQKVKKYAWHKPILDKGYAMMECPAYDPEKDFVRDPTGYYVLIRVNFELGRIEVAICRRDHKIIKAFRGRSAQDLYYAVFQFEKKNHVQWFSEKSHIAYLGKELKKAELALVQGNNAYFQE